MTEEPKVPPRRGSATEPVEGREGPREGAGAPDRSKRRRGRYIPRRRVCFFCVEKIGAIDYKDIGMLRRFVSDRGKIDTRRRTGTCAKHQRKLAVALKRARHLALLPYTAEHARLSGASHART